MRLLAPVTAVVFWVVVFSVAVSSLSGCSAQPAVTLPYRQSFDGPTLGAEWSMRGGAWELVDGRLFNDGARNVPLWLSASLPDDVRVTFSAESRSPAVDIKFEIFGNGRDHQSGYVVILSGWRNSKSIIARLDEHGPQRTRAQTKALQAEVTADSGAAVSRHERRAEIAARLHRGELGRRYRFRFERKGHDLRFYVDDALHLRYFDPSPLRGPGNDRFAFSNWESKVYFDDLIIEAL